MKVQHMVQMGLVVLIMVSATAPSRARAQDSLSRVITPENADQVVELAQFDLGETYSVAISPSEDRAAIASADGVTLLDLAHGEQIPLQALPTAQATSVAFAPDGQTLLSGGTDGTVRLWDVTTGLNLWTVDGHPQVCIWECYGVLSVAFAPDGQTVLSGGIDGTVRLWNAQTGQHHLTVRHGMGCIDIGCYGVLSVAFAPDGLTFLSGGGDGTVRLWETNSGTLLRIGGDHTSTVRSVAFAPDGQTALSGGADGARLWDIRTGDVLRVFVVGPTYGAMSVVFAPNGACLATGSYESGVSIWGIPGGC